jgi:hypothetical protein
MKMLSTRRHKVTAGILAAILAFFVLSAESCTGNDDFDKRKVSTAAKADPNRTTLEKQNLTKRKALQENSNQIGYVYMVSFGKPWGYYVIKGKVSNSGSQLTPEQDIICRYSNTCTTVDGPQDDGTYGSGDPGIFFFTASGNYVETSLDYVYSAQPLEVEVTLLGK